MTDGPDGLLEELRGELLRRLASLDRALAALASTRGAAACVESRSLIGREAHRLQGSAATLHLAELRDIAAGIAELARADRSPDPRAIARARRLLSAQAAAVAGDAGSEALSRLLVDPGGGERALTVVLVEDNSANVRAFELLMSRRPNVTLLTTSTGAEGLELARGKPDLVLLDLHLPDVSGEEILRRLRDDPATAGVPVAIISADATPASVDRLRAAGAWEYLTKPLDLRRVLALFDSLPER